jgi:hypothetical protein
MTKQASMQRNAPQVTQPSGDQPEHPPEQSGEDRQRYGKEEKFTLSIDSCFSSAPSSK